MKRSPNVSLSLVSTLASAALAAGCGSRRADGWQTCVDRAKGVAVEQQSCDDDRARAASQPGYVPQYYWYYYPRGLFSSAPGLGMPVPLGGVYGTAPMSSVPVAHGDSISRGGFGSTAGGHASGGA